MFSKIKRSIYSGNRPNWIAKLLNNFWGRMHSAGLAPENWVSLEVKGRKSGKMISFPIVIALHDGQSYVVSMLGDDAQWVKNVRADQGTAYIQRQGRKEVQLDEIAVNQRAPILKAYLQQAPGARPHMPVDKDAPLAEFEAIAEQFPAFHIISK